MISISTFLTSFRSWRVSSRIFVMICSDMGERGVIVTWSFRGEKNAALLGTNVFFAQLGSVKAESYALWQFGLLWANDKSVMPAHKPRCDPVM